MLYCLQVEFHELSQNKRARLALVLFFCFVFKKKLERKKKSKRHSESARRQREPYRQQKPLHLAHAGEYVKLNFP